MSPVFRCYELHSVASRDTFFFFYFTCARGNLFTRSFNDLNSLLWRIFFSFWFEQRRKLTKVLLLFSLQLICFCHAMSLRVWTKGYNPDPASRLDFRKGAYDTPKYVYDCLFVWSWGNCPPIILLITRFQDLASRLANVVLQFRLFIKMVIPMKRFGRVTWFTFWRATF